MNKLATTLTFTALLALPLTAASKPKNPQQACWGQASKVFAQTGEMGKHSAEQPTPRLGLRNLARALYEAGVIADDSMEALGVFVADELGLSIEACMNF
ncbi:hypothetical protein [Thalassotalea mangrovi]|uniref:Uncharacterized protein n=1 Tax=Thalassotalea mangrovi TaxID=2572245 RepID=A0A4U1B5J0_9GAMM|nr:hypothetical protein [Thalassotalea mangrovi]TKB45668.1 hypothetical protein E8M12_07850 [Thalassotalea mangrovi]